jgi:outer membrane protein
MKKFTHTLLALGAFCTTALISHAESTPKIVVVDMAKIFDTHYETVAENIKLKADRDKAQASFDQLTKERDDLYKQYKDIVDQSQNPTATADAKAGFQAAAQKKGTEVQAKVKEMQDFGQQAQQALQTRIQNFRSTMMEEISKTVVKIAQTHNASLVLDKSGVGVTGVAMVIYSDPSYDITAEVAADIVKNKPAALPAVAPDASTPMPAAPMTPAAAPSDTPSITVPGAK